MENKILKIKNYFLYNIVNPLNQKEIVVRSFQVWLMNLKLHGSLSRSRTRFIKLITDRIKEIDEERIKIAKEHAKNDKGEIIYIKDGKKSTKEVDGSVFDIKDIDKFMKEWEEYLNEDYIIDVTPSNKDIIDGVKSILLSTNDEFEGREAVRYDEWCEAFEAVWAKSEETPKEVKEFIKENK